MQASIFLFLFISAISQAARDPAVVKITAQHDGARAIGSGVCLDKPCVHVLTNYHVAAYLGGEMKVEGVAVRNTQAFTGPGDRGAQAMDAAFGRYRYNPAKDLALLTLASALPAGFSGARFAAYEPRIGQDVVRSARFGDEYDLAAGKIAADAVTHAAANGTLTALPQHFLLDCPSRPGNSGGAVKDSEGKVIGLVIMRSTNDQGQAGTIAVSSLSIAEFLRTANEQLWKELFPREGQATGQSQPEAMPAGLGAITAAAAEQNDSIQMLRAKARENAQAMQNVVALESINTWGQNQSKRSYLYQIAMYSDGQKYQKLGASGAPAKQPATSAIAWPRMTGVVPGEQWSILSLLMDDAAIAYQGRSVYEGAAVHVFRYNSSATGCASRYMGRKIYAGCSGVVVADKNMNALLITQRMDLPAGDASVIRWTEKYEMISVGARPILLPTELTMSGDFRTGKTYYASARWTGYRVFAAETSLRFDEAVE